MKGDYFSNEDVFNMLGGLRREYIQNRKTFYELNSGDIVVLRKNAQLSSHYWYNVQRDLLLSDAKYVVCVAGYENVYCIPLSLISTLIERGHISLERKRPNYKLVLRRIAGKMCLCPTGSEEPISIEQFQVYCQSYEKTNEISSEQAASLSEGAKKAVFVNAYERNPIARQKCVEHYGSKCQVCGFDFAETYGPGYEGLIEVHHIIPISSIQSEYVVDPINDLIPLCSNCHTAIHRKFKDRYLSIDELRKRIKKIPPKENA